MEIWLILLSAGITIFAFNLLLVSLLSYKKFHNMKLLFVSIVFLLFFIRGIYFSIQVFYEEVYPLPMVIFIWLFDVLMLIFLYVVSLKR